MQSFQSGIMAQELGEGVILFSRFYSELHSLGTIIVDVNSISAAAMSDACKVSTAMASRLFVLFYLARTHLDARRNNCACIDLDCVFAYKFSVVKA